MIMRQHKWLIPPPVCSAICTNAASIPVPTQFPQNDSMTFPITSPASTFGTELCTIVCPTFSAPNSDRRVLELYRSVQFSAATCATVRNPEACNRVPLFFTRKPAEPKPFEGNPMQQPGLG